MRRFRIDCLEVSCICRSAAPFGTGVRGADMFRLYDAYRAAGGNFFDTAHCYCFWLENGMGASEKALGECLRRSGDRREVVIGTKGGHPAVLPKYPRPDAYLAPEVIASDIRDSLERLGVDQIDLYFLHRDDQRVPVAEIMDAVNAEIAGGRIRCAGASNWTAARMEEANAYAAKNNLKGFVASQPQWNLAQPNPPADPTLRFVSEGDELWHAKNRFPIVAYSPTACGYFASADMSKGKAFDNPVSRQRHARVRELAAQLGVTPNQIALAWLMCQPFPVIPILGTTDATHQSDAIGATSLKLTAAQLDWLRNG